MATSTSFVPSRAAANITAARQARVVASATPIMRCGNSKALILKPVSPPAAEHVPPSPRQSPQSRPRDVAAGAFAIMHAPNHTHHQQEGQDWLSQLLEASAALIRELQGSSQQQDEDEEWRILFGSALDPKEEAGGRHSMYTSHLAERMATERR